MRFWGGLIKFISFIFFIGSTLVCGYMALEAFEQKDKEYLYSAVILWVVLLLISLIVSCVGTALKAVAKLKKKYDLLEQKVDKILLAQATMNRMGAPIEQKEISVPEKEGIPEEKKPDVASTNENSSAAPVATNRELPELTISAEESDSTNKLILFVIIGVLLLAAVVLAVLGLTKVKAGKEKLDTEVTSTVSVEEVISEDEDVTETAEPILFGESISNEFFDMTFDSMEIVEEYKFKTGENISHSLFVEDGYELLMIKGLFVNNHTEVIKDSYFSLSAVVNDVYVAGDNDVRLAFERNNTHEIDPYTEQNVVIYMNIPKKLVDDFKTATFTIGFNNDLAVPSVSWVNSKKIVEVDQCYSITSDASIVASDKETMLKEEAIPLTIGDTICTEDYELTVTGIKMSYEVLPSQTGSVYTSYPAESGKVYIDVEATVKNTMQRDIRIEELFKASAVYDGKYPYTGFTIVDDGNRFDWVDHYVAATPLETCIAHSLIECPVEVDNSGKPVVVYIELKDSVFEYVLR